jgi:hypothetical protein
VYNGKYPVTAYNQDVINRLSDLIKNKNDYIERLCKWISDHFIGYSINHVNGRFKADELKTFSEVSELLKKQEDI